MQILKSLAEMKAWRQGLPAGKRVGFVPTMGALHAGHMHLMAESKSHTDVTVVSIFVNPLQFGPNEDFHRYPRPIEADIRLLTDAGVDALFHPSVEDFYNVDHSTSVDVGGLDASLCGASRPGHFRGVCTVVLKLFHLVAPHQAFFGQKDIQQALILRRMVRDLAVPVDLQIVPTVREETGIAMSSRNRYLSEGEKRRATAISRGLMRAFAEYTSGERNGNRLKDLVLRQVMDSYPTRIDYIEVVDQETLRPQIALTRPSVLAVAVYFGRTRLIDNFLLP